MLFTKFYKQMNIKKYKWNYCKGGRRFGRVVAGAMENIEQTCNLGMWGSKSFVLNKYQYLIKIWCPWVRSWTRGAILPWLLLLLFTLYRLMYEIIYFWFIENNPLVGRKNYSNHPKRLFLRFNVSFQCFTVLKHTTN